MILAPGTGVLRIAAVATTVLMAVGLVLYARRRERIAARLGDKTVLSRLIGGDSLGVSPYRIAAIAAAALALALALLDPAIAAGPRASRGPVVLLLDASGSMLAEDAGARRLDRQRVLARDLLDTFADRPVGLVVYAGRAYALTPPTRDRGALDLYLDALDPSIVTQSGSALAAAIRQGVGLIMSGAGPAGGTLVLLGDGDETESAEAARDAARLARRNGITLHVVGIGDAEGAAVPALDLTTGTVDGWLLDPAGEVYLSRRDDQLLHSLAREGGRGVYLLGDEAGAISALDDAVRGGSDPPPGGVRPHHLLALVAFVLLLLEPALRVWNARARSRPMRMGDTR